MSPSLVEPSEELHVLEPEGMNRRPKGLEGEVEDMEGHEQKESQGNKEK